MLSGWSHRQQGTKMHSRESNWPTICFASALALSSVIVRAQPANAQTLKTVKERGSLACGVNQGLPGFSSPDDKGVWSGLDVDLCRAIAAAIFNDPGKVRFVPLSTAERFEALRSGKIDVLARNSTWTMSREIDLGLSFAGVNYYDGQGFLVHKVPEMTSALELDGAKICVQTDTTTVNNLIDYFQSNNLKYEVVGAASPAEALKDYDQGLCSVLSSDVSQLYAQRLQLAKPGDHIILPDIISKEPLGPAVRQDDPQWLSVVKWVHFAMIDAEELGIGSNTVDQALLSKKPDVMRLVGTEGDFGERLGLTKAWAANAIRTVGNYGEVFERNVGSRSKLGIPRGLNQLWNIGGIQYAPPIR
ncbi:amino acid ABC transporter substrate-binding protein, PAAT family [Rhizobiales bacterium GAS113]|nr:amino acid ABC transporter substrate-binding protein, PAAT family [Rhizobiales bacterium GAS113]